MECEITRPTVMEVDLDAFDNNVNQIRNYVGKDVEIMPVIKANAYGTYINKCIDKINEFNIVAVATVDEGVSLRKNGYKNKIFVLNQAYKTEISKILEYDISIGLSSDEFLKALGNTRKEVDVQIEIGSGMGRTGIHPERAQEYIENVQKFSNINIEGIYTHLSSPDCDEEYTKEQLKSFNYAVDIAKNKIKNLKYIHAAASNALINFKDSLFNLVRPGLILYGYDSENGATKKLNLKPVCKLKSKVIFLKTVNKGTSIGYSRSFITNKESKIATIPIGYADGLRRNLSNNGVILINGKKAPIVGKICMDSFMADVTEIDNINVGDDIYIWDNENITLDEIAQKCDTINYEILSTISERVPRKFIRKGI